jgi:hypothetical protein
MSLSDVVEMPLEQKYFQEEKTLHHKSTLFESKLKKEKKQ